MQTRRWALGMGTRGTMKLDCVLIEGGREWGWKRSRGPLGQAIIYPHSVNESLLEPLDASLAFPQILSYKSPDCCRALLQLMNLLFRSGLDISRSHCSCFQNNPWATWTGEAKVSPAVQKNDLMWNKVDFSHRPPSEACRTGGFIFDPACCPFGRKTISQNADAMTGTENDSGAFFGRKLIFAHVLTGTIK